MNRRARLVVLVSGSGSNLQAILDACTAGDLPADVALVVSNKPGVFALERAATAGVPTAVVPPGPGEQRPDYDARLAEVVASAEPTWIVLAGWMRILSMGFLGRFPHRVINLHPALPGELPGTHAIERAFDEAQQGLRTRTGVMVHLVPDEGVDDGPVLATTEVPIHHTDTPDTLAQRVHASEHQLLVDVLRDLTAKETTHA